MLVQELIIILPPLPLPGPLIEKQCHVLGMHARLFACLCDLFIMGFSIQEA